MAQADTGVGSSESLSVGTPAAPPAGRSVPAGHSAQWRVRVPCATGRADLETRLPLAKKTPPGHHRDVPQAVDESTDSERTWRAPVQQRHWQPGSKASGRSQAASASWATSSPGRALRVCSRTCAYAVPDGCKLRVRTGMTRTRKVESWVESWARERLASLASRCSRSRSSQWQVRSPFDLRDWCVCGGDPAVAEMVVGGELHDAAARGDLEAVQARPCS